MTGHGATSSTDGSGRAFGRGSRVLIALAAAVVLFVGVWFARDLLAPAALAAVVVIIAYPVRRPLERAGWPVWLASTAVIVVAYLILAVLAVLLVYAVGQFVAMLPELADDLQATAGGVADWLQGLGFSAPSAQTALGWLDPGAIGKAALGVADQVLGFATAFFFVLAYVIFMAVDGARFRAASAAASAWMFGNATADRIATRYFTGVRRYYVVNATFGAIVAVLDGLLLWAVGVPIPAVWAILAFVTNFIPNIGFVIGLIPPAILALVVGGWPLMLAVIAIYCVINVVLQVLVQPKFVSDAVGLSLTLTFFSVVFWAFVIGPIGAILSVPLSLLVRALLLEPDRGAVALRRLTGEGEDSLRTSGSRDVHDDLRAAEPESSTRGQEESDVVEQEA
ncbi:AI-2E family transporter [Agromyces sp. S2-1-8]|uniref:AI-2E family transporter n=1 Tax=Agromyces sp. S2-1-8 TaxID=2897180 RepID=UPI001E3ADD86|nr:AI-2E family transporter [Agromyces sp. S2-1-8]MCD5345607.1 AI-2E family transporter [Agromyces sp. S2-1-8]